MCLCAYLEWVKENEWLGWREAERETETEDVVMAKLSSSIFHQNDSII